MATRSRTPSRIISRMFKDHPEAVRQGFMDPESEMLSFTVIANGVERRGSIERSVGVDAARATIVYVDLEQGNLEGDYHSRNYSTDNSSREWTKRDLFGPESDIWENEQTHVDGVEFPCKRDDITELTNLLSIAQVVPVPAHTS